VTEEAAEAEASPGRRWFLSGVRTRILFWPILTLALGILLAVVAIRQVLFAQVDARIDDQLVQEADELRSLAGGRDPLTGERFGTDVSRVFEVFLDRNVPQRNETYLAFTGGETYVSRQEPPVLLHEDAGFVSRVRGAETTDRGSYETPAGGVEYLAVPVIVNGERRGVFVSAFFRELEAAEVGPATEAAAEVGLLTLLLGAIVAWWVAGSVLRPVAATTETARRISTRDLTRRVLVSGNDELAELGRTFNHLLDRLEDTFETQRRFVDDAGHELRTPITIVRGHLELLDDDPAERRKTLALVQEELDRMQRIVTDLLTLAKAERPDFLVLEPVELEPLTDDLLEKARALGDRGWRVDEVARCVLVADRQRLTQAVMQLAQNAVEHTAAGTEIGIGSLVTDGHVRLWVRDTGEGIAAGDLARIFGRFSRGGRRRSSEGAGLGLSIVRAIAVAHHGDVEVDSAVGRGSTFTLVLPVDQPHDDEEVEA
jgi:signal transduction histidine kinase